MENNLKAKAKAWFTIVKDVVTDTESFKNLFLKQFIWSITNGKFFEMYQGTINIGTIKTQ